MGEAALGDDSVPARAMLSAGTVERLGANGYGGAS